MLKDGVTFTVSMSTLYPAAACPTCDVVDLIILHIRRSATVYSIQEILCESVSLS